MAHRRVDDVAGAVLRRAVGEFDQALAALRVSLHEGAVPDPEAVHTTRVAIRRLRAVLRAMEECTGADRARMARDLLGTLARALGAVRDLDVLAGAVAVAGGGLEHGDVAAVAAHVAAARAEAVVHLSGALERFSGGGGPAILARIGEVRDDDRDSREWACEVLGAQWRGVRRAHRSLARAVGAVGGERASTDPSVAEELHRLRLRAKRLRYVAEALGGVVPGTGRVARAARELTDDVGRTRDVSTGARWLAQLASLHPEVGFTAGRLAERLAAGAEPIDVDRSWREVKAAVQRAGW